MRYNNYHKHTHYSNIITPDCIVKVEDYAKRAMELGHTTLSTCEHGYAGNVFEYYEVAKKYGLKLVFGVEYYYVDDRFEKDRSNSHLMILAKNENGKRQMTKIMSEANLTGYYHKPRIDKELLFSLNPHDVVVTSTCVISYINKHDDYENNFVKPLIDYFGDNFYLEIHDNTHPMQVEYNKKILELHNKYNVPFIHATDSHYIYPEQDKDRTAFLESKGIYYPEEEGFMLDYPDSDAIFERYEKQGVFTKEQVEAALINTLIIDDFEDIALDKEIKMPSIYPTFSHEQKMGKLKEIVGKEWLKDKENIDSSRLKEYQEAIKFEMNIIKETKMEDYFLFNYEVIKRAKEKGGVLTRTGRGSAPSYYLNKLLGFTEVDRLNAPITLYPTRFMSKSRILETKSLPDVDFNTANPDIFTEAAKEILGDDHCYVMTAYGTLQESGAFRITCKMNGMEMSEYNEVGKNLDKYKNDPKWIPLIEESQKFIGVIDSVSPHPCANLVYDKSISEELGVIRVGDETKGKKKIVYCALIDSDTSDAYKYLKDDFLSVTVWKIIAETFKVINKPIPDVRELEKLVESDDKVWQLYEKGLTATLNQTGTDSGTPQIVQYKPKSVRELSGWVSAIRPSFASMKDYFLNRKEFSYGIPAFDNILKESDNFVLYQENIMSALVYAGFPEDETYGLLKAIAKKKPGIIEPIQERFMKGFIDKTGSEENAKKVWKIIEDAVGYGFNSSHAYSVALDSLYGAYLKANYPLAYYSVVLKEYSDDTKTTAKIMKELNHFGIKILPPKFRKSRGDYFPDERTNSIYKGIGSIKKLNVSCADELYELREESFNSFIELLNKVYNESSVGLAKLKILTTLNFFDEFGQNKKLLNLIDEYEKKLKNKKLKQETKDQRLIELKQMEKEMKDEKLGIREQIQYEIDYYGYEVSTIETLPDNVFMVTDIDTKYAPKPRLYCLKTGDVLVIKCFKNDMKKNPFAIGSIIQPTKKVMQPKKRKTETGWEETGDHEEILKEWKVLK